MAKLEELAKELQTILKNSDEELEEKELSRERIKEIISHVKNDEYNREILIQELVDANLGWFASKLKNRYFD